MVSQDERSGSGSGEAFGSRAEGVAAELDSLMRCLGGRSAEGPGQERVGASVGLIVEDVKDRAQANELARGWRRFALRRIFSLSMRHLLIISGVMEMTRSPVSGLRKLLTAEGGNRLRRCTGMEMRYCHLMAGMHPVGALSVQGRGVVADVALLKAVRL